MNQWREAFKSRRVLNIAHRGARAFAPENTLAAIELAAELGADAVELDVHHSKDETIVVVHDDALTRCSNVAAAFPSAPDHYVSSFSLDQLQQLDSGSWYIDQLELGRESSEVYLRDITASEQTEFLPPQRLASFADNVGISTLAQCLELACSLKLLVNVEVKSLPRMYPRLTADVVDTIQKLDCGSTVLVSSFDHRQLVIVRDMSTEIATGVLTGSRLANPREYLRWTKADAYHPCCNGNFDSTGLGSVDGDFDTELIESVRSIDAGIQPWTANDAETIKQFLDAGVSGIISDFPNRVAALLDDSQ